MKMASSRYLSGKLGKKYGGFELQKDTGAAVKNHIFPLFFSFPF